MRSLNKCRKKGVHICFILLPLYISIHIIFCVCLSTFLLVTFECRKIVYNDIINNKKIKKEKKIIIKKSYYSLNFYHIFFPNPWEMRRSYCLGKVEHLVDRLKLVGNMIDIVSLVIIPECYG